MPPITMFNRWREDLHAGRLAYTVEDVRRHLNGRALACWCHIGPCHAGTLITIANQEQP